MEISRGEKRHWGMKKEKKKRPKKKERIPFYQENRKILDESNWYSLHAGVQMRSPSNQN